MNRDSVTPLLITFNEIQNIERTLAKLDWARRIVVVDSGSTDGTLDVLARDARIEVIHRPFDSFAGQCNFGLSHIHTDWVLSLDADYAVSAALVDAYARAGEAEIGAWMVERTERMRGREARTIHVGGTAIPVVARTRPQPVVPEPQARAEFRAWFRGLPPIPQQDVP